MKRLLRAIAVAVPALWAASAHANDDGLDVFLRYCALCHGAAADGGGQMARLLDRRPSDLRRSLLSKDERERIVRLGGAAVSRSPSMPAWESELSDAQLAAVFRYLDAVRISASASR